MGKILEGGCSDFFDNPEVGEAKHTQGGFFQELEKNPQEIAQHGIAGDDVVIRPEYDRAPDESDRQPIEKASLNPGGNKRAHGVPVYHGSGAAGS